MFEISIEIFDIYTTRQNFLGHSKRCDQDLWAEWASKFFGRRHNTALFELIARFQFPYRIILS